MDAIFGIAGKLAIFYQVTENPFPREIFRHFLHINSLQIKQNNSKIAFFKIAVSFNLT